MEFEKRGTGFGAVMATGLTAAIAAVEKEVIRFVAATTAEEEELDDDDEFWVSVVGLLLLGLML